MSGNVLQYCRLQMQFMLPIFLLRYLDCLQVRFVLKKKLKKFHSVTFNHQKKLFSLQRKGEERMERYLFLPLLSELFNINLTVTEG